MIAATIRTKTEGYIISNEFINGFHKIVYRNPKGTEYIVEMEDDYFYHEQFEGKTGIGCCLTQLIVTSFDENGVQKRQVTTISITNRDIFLNRRTKNLLSKFEREQKLLEKLFDKSDI